MFGYIIIVATLAGLIGGFVGGMWGYTFLSKRQQARDKKDLDDASTQMRIQRDSLSTASSDELDSCISDSLNMDKAD